MRDIVILTIDSWRRDQLNQMPRLKQETADWDSMTGVSHSSKTYLAFPSLLAGSIPTSSYDETGTLLPDINPLPTILARRGYSSCGVIASNPNVQQWANYFDSFWNDEIETTTSQYTSNIESWYKRVKKTLLMRKEVSATEIGERAERWYSNTDGPRFLWMHLMEPHFPYYPGIRKASEVGLINAYQTTIDFHQKREAVAEKHRDTLYELYNKTVERLDEQISSVLNFIDDDAIVVITGDHGEEFDHGIATHDHLYEECVTVPFLSRGVELFSERETVRHLDVAPTLLDEIGIDIPEGWGGRIAEDVSSESPVRMVNILGKSVYTGIRTDRHKLLKSFNADGTTTKEFYSLSRDPDEETNLIGIEQPPENLERELEAFIQAHGLDTIRKDSQEFISEVATDRLKDLGYV